LLGIPVALLKIHLRYNAKPAPFAEAGLEARRNAS